MGACDRCWCLFHNAVLHPIAGVLWAFGLMRAGDFVHELGKIGIE